MRGPRLISLAAAAAAGVLLAGCTAEENRALIPQDDADQIIASLDGIETAVADGDCDLAQEQLSGAVNQVAALPGRVDQDLRARLQEGLDHLAGRIPQDCEAAAEPEETPTPEATPTPTPEATPTPTPEETPTADPTETPPTEGDSGEGGGDSSGEGGGDSSGEGGGGSSGEGGGEGDGG